MRSERNIFVASCLLAGVAACGVTEIDPISTGGAGAGQTIPSTSQGGRDAVPTVDASSSVSSSSGGPGCNGVVVETEPHVRDVDVIIVVDNSPSMVDEIAALEQELYPNFAYRFDAQAVDAQIILLTDHGNEPTEVCIGPPLAGPSASCNGLPGDVSGRFHHYSAPVGDHDGLCRLLDSYNGVQDGATADEFGLHDEGWSTWLRKDALKAIVVLSDDGLSCTWRGEVFDDADDPSLTPATSQAAVAAADWDRQLLQRASFHFGTVAQRNYQLYSFVGLAEPQAPPIHAGFGPDYGLVTSQCLGATSPGFGYQWLSRATGARRYPSCNDGTYDLMFRNMASSILDGASDRCTLVVTETEPYETDNLEVEYSPGTQTERERFPEVADASACGGDGFYIEDGLIRLCPLSCQRVNQDTEGHLDLIANCKPIP